MQASARTAEAARFNAAVFASGGGSNFQSLLDHAAEGRLWRVAVLVSNREAGALDRARAAGVEAVIVPTKDRPEAEVVTETLAVLDRHAVDLVILAGYLKLLPAGVVGRYPGRILNIHPALLPEFGGQGMYGMNVHRAVVDSGATRTGATVHLVDEEYDRGATLARWTIPVRPEDTPEDVARRVLSVEHELYPKAVDHLCAALAEGRAVEPMNDIHLAEPPQTKVEES
jgi:phosphoribosylglycinamide formyltransferase-1